MVVGLELFEIIVTVWGDTPLLCMCSVYCATTVTVTILEDIENELNG